MYRYRLAWIGLCLLIAAGGIFYLVSSSSWGSIRSQPANEPDLQAAAAQIGDLTLMVSGSGELVPMSEVSLGYQERGELVELNVQVGDQVCKGDVLAVMQRDETEAEMASNLASAQLQVIQIQQKLDHLYENAQLAKAQALLTLEEAESQLEILQNYELEQALALQDLRQAEKTVEDAEMDLYILNSSPSKQAIDTAYASLTFKEKKLSEIQDQISQVEYQFISSRDPVVRDRLDLQLKDLRVRLTNQQLQVNNARYKYENLDNPPDEFDLTLAEAKLNTAQAQLAAAQMKWQKVQGGPPLGELAMVEAQYAEARAAWESLRNGPDPAEIALLEAELARAEANLELLEGSQLRVELIAPLDGSVLSIEAQVHDWLGDQTILTLVDVSQRMLEVFLDEVDLAELQVGERAEIIFDALPDTTFHGEVVQVDPSLVRAGNTQAVRVLVLMDAPSNDLVNLPLGLNAGVDIIAGEATNAVLVSTEALHIDADGGYAVYVIDNESFEVRPIEVGLMDATVVEVVAGLQPGEEVAIGQPDFNQELVNEN